MSALWVTKNAPNFLLKKRQRLRCRARNTNDGGYTGSSSQRKAALTAPIDKSGKCRHGRMVGDCSKTQVDTKRRMDLRGDNGTCQRVTAEVKEIVIPADITQLKNVGPNIGEQHLRFRSRLFTLAIVANGKGILAESFTIDLVTPVREAVQEHDFR